MIFRKFGTALIVITLAYPVQADSTPHDKAREAAGLAHATRISGIFAAMNAARRGMP